MPSTSDVLVCAEKLACCSLNIGASIGNNALHLSVDVNLPLVTDFTQRNLDVLSSFSLGHVAHSQLNTANFPALLAFLLFCKH